MFQEATYSYLIFSRVLCSFGKSTSSHPFFQRHWVKLSIPVTNSIKDELQPWVLSNLLFLLEKQLQQWDIKVTNHDIPLIAGTMYLLKNSLLFDEISCNHSFFSMILSLFQENTRDDSFCWEYCIYFTTLTIATCFILQTMVDLKKFTVFIWVKHLQHYFFQHSVYFTEAAAVIFVWRELIVLNE